MRTTKNYAEVIRQELRSNPDLADAVEDERFNANLAEEIYNARIQSGKTQAELAECAGMIQSAIARAGGRGLWSLFLTTLKRIAKALCKRWK